MTLIVGKSIERIIFLSQHKLSQWQYDRLGIDLLKKKGFRVEYWEYTSIVPPEISTTGIPRGNHAFDGLKSYNSDCALLVALGELTARDVVVVTGLLFGDKVFRKISRSKALWGTPFLGAFPEVSKENSFLLRLQRLVRRPGLIGKFISTRNPLKCLGVRAFDFYLAGGEFLPKHHLINAHTRRIDAHSFDYDRHLLAPRRESKAEPAKNVVFLDSYGPFHPDYETLGISFPCSAEEYFPNCNSFFRLVEERFGCSVVIAAHPRSRYEGRGNLFEERSVVRDHTRQLIQEAKLVLASNSTAVSFAVIYNKPIIFLAINPRVRNICDMKIRCLASLFGKQPIHWTGDENVDWDRELTIDEKRYTEYMATYIKKPGSPEKPCWEVFANYLETLPG